MGASVFCGWANPRPEFGAVPGVMCPAEHPWEALQTNDRNMALGRYDERDPAITKQRLAWMEEAKIDFCTYQIEWAHEHTQPSKLPAWRKQLPSPLTMAHCADNHSPDSSVRFCISWWGTMERDPLWQEMKGNGWTAADVIESQRRFAQTVAVLYVTRPSYLSIDGKPVLMRGAAEGLQFYESEFGLSPAQIIGLWRDEVRQVTGKELYLIATSTVPDDRHKLKAWGFDALTEYLLHGDGWQDTMDTYRYWWALDLAFCKAQGLDYWVPATAGYDSKAWGSPESVSHLPTPAQFMAHLAEARTVAAENRVLTRGMVLTYAWNEIGEGGCIEPMARGQLHDGDEMIRAHQAACS